VVVFFTLQTIEKAKCAVGVQLARSIVNGLVHLFEVGCPTVSNNSSGSGLAPAKIF